MAVQGNGAWHEVFLLKPLDAEGCLWICLYKSRDMKIFFTAVRLAPGAAIQASDLTNKRSMPGLNADQVQWLSEQGMWDGRAISKEAAGLWSPTNQDKEALMADIAVMSKLSAMPETFYFLAGQNGQTFQDVGLLAASQQNPAEVQPFRFAAILRADTWIEVFLVMSMSADGSKWLCYTSTNYDSMVWAAVQLTPNSFLMADNNDVSSGRRYAGVPEQAIFWICSQSDYTTAWAPTAEEVQFLTAEAQTVSARQ